MYFSIICPTYNSSKFIRKTIYSLINQEYRNFEVIFSDDGSTDDTIEILNNYKLEFKKIGIDILIIKSEHKGPGHARNKALQLAKYDWISFIDSDDLWSENKLIRVSNFLKQNINYNCILHRQFFLGLNNKIKEYNYDKYFDSKLPVKKQLFKSPFIAMSTVTIKKNLIIEVGGFNEKYQNAQDYDLWLRIGDNFKIHILPEFLGSYSERVGNITSRPYLLRIKNILIILNKNKKNIGKITYFLAVIKILLSKEWFSKIFK